MTTLRTAAHNDYGLVGQSAEMASVRRLIEKASRSRLPVLVLGETGTGKELVARAVHNCCPRGKFVPIDCGSLVGTLMESELFGHAKGSFSGAVENKKGLVELADGGTIFFDEIGDLPLEMQVKLLRLLQEHEFRAVGSLQWRKVDLRIIAATHRDLKAEVAKGRFRQDLYYRLNVFSIHLPALCRRRGDILLLIDHFVAGQFLLSPDILQTLLAYDWPGNVRELKHCIERMAALNSEGVFQAADMPSALLYHEAGLKPSPEVVVEQDSEMPSHTLYPTSPVISLPESKRNAICAALEATNGQRAKAAELLRTSRTTLYRKMKEYGID